MPPTYNRCVTEYIDFVGISKITTIIKGWQQRENEKSGRKT